MTSLNKNWSLVIACSFLLACNTSHISSNNSSNNISNTPGISAIPYYPLEHEKDLDVLVKEIGDSRVVLLGESTHGTGEYYQWRAAITKKLIQEKGFDFIAVEGDWVDSYKVNQFIKGSQQDSSSAIEILKQYDRWPESMWGNYEIVPLVLWLNNYNQANDAVNKIGFYGLDLYSFWEWTQQKLTVKDSSIQNAIRQVKENFSLYKNDALKYADAVRKSKTDYHESTEYLWKTVQNLFGNVEPRDESQFLLQQQALLSLQGERYFRTMVTDRVQSWNIRDGYMAETIKRLLQFHGNNSKAIIWVHNGHAGDAHYSNMGDVGYTSVSEILRNEFGRNKIFSAAFGTDKGFVMAGYSWDAPVQKQFVLPAKTGSWESMLHELSAENKIVLSKDIKNNGSLNKWIEFRSIGASYSGAAVYGRSIIPQRFDAFLFIDSTTALHPIKK
jgi:erythromycin esterase-like protein